MRTLLGLASACVVIAALHAAQPLVLPLVLAFFASVLTHPLVALLKRRGFPTAWGVTLVVACAVLLLALVFLLTTASLTRLGELLPGLEARLFSIAVRLTAWLRAHGVPVPWHALEDATAPASMLPLFARAAESAAALLGQLGVSLVVMVFMLLEASALRDKLATLPAPLEHRLARLAEGGAELQRYLITKTWISVLSGVVVGLWLWLLGLELPLLFGLLAFVLNFIPNVGSLIAAAPAVLLALLHEDPMLLLGVLACYLVVDLGIGNLLEPLVMGRRMGLSPLAVLLSLVFWGWVLGPLGMFLSVPLTMSARVLVAGGELAWLAHLLEAPPSKPLGRRPEPAPPT